MFEQRVVPAPITWERVRKMFNDPVPPVTVWERQFDYSDDALHRIARTRYEDFDFNDLHYYYLDLAYVELQPEVFNYLFPVCLMDWHESLMKNVGCTHGDSEFHLALHRGGALNRLVTAERKEAIYEFFRDSFLIRLDTQQKLSPDDESEMRYDDRWLLRFNSLGVTLPRIDLLWNPWWSCDTVGRSIAVLKFCSTLMYVDWLNILYLPRDGSIPKYNSVPPLWLNDSDIYDSGWLDENIQFLRDTLSVDFIHDRLNVAANCITEQDDLSLVERLVADWPGCRQLVERRLQELPRFLKSDKNGGLEWSN
ncbi:MAG: Uncharacterized protein JWP89_3578 [Schlesneria sp.]|nr:Uncharacterized protein [Schlesneria sp.]